MRFTNLLSVHPLHTAELNQRQRRMRGSCTLSTTGPYTSTTTCESSTPCGWQYMCNLDGSCTAGNVPAGTTGYTTQADCFNQCKIIKGAKCSASDPAIYQANTSTKVLRLYSWDTYVSWGQPATQVIDCTGYTTGPVMPMKT